MIKLGLFSLLTLLAVLCEPLVNGEIANPAIRPDLLLVPVVVAVVASPGPTAVVSGALIGLVCDCLTGPQLGPQMAAIALIAGIGSLISLRSKSIVDVFLLAFGCVFLARSAAMAARHSLDSLPFGSLASAGQIAGTSFVTAVSLVALLLVIRRIARPFARHSWVGQSKIATLGWSRSAD
jgi:rod shape-determining protein MreD